MVIQIVLDDYQLREAVREWMSKTQPELMKDYTLESVQIMSNEELIEASDPRIFLEPRSDKTAN